MDVFTHDAAAVSWRFSNQSLITRSTMKAEQVNLELAWSEAEWLKGFLSELHIVKKLMSAILIYYNNQANLAKVKSKKHNSKSS